MSGNVGARRFPSAGIQTLSGAGFGESIVIVTMMMVFPSTVATVVMPPALVAVVPFVAVTVAVDRGWRVDHWWLLIHDRRGCDIDWSWHTQINSDVRVSERRARCARSGKADCQKKRSVFHGVLLSCSFLAGARQWRTTRILRGARGSGCGGNVKTVTGSNPL